MSEEVRKPLDASTILDVAAKHELLGAVMSDETCKLLGVPKGTRYLRGVSHEDIIAFANAIRDI
jgi:hypothetical protein